MTEPEDLLPVGLADQLPARALASTLVMRAMLDTLDSHGYDRVRPPLIEFERSMAQRMAGVSPRQMIRFVDPASLRTLALRSDITVQVGRIAATSLRGAARPLRLCYAGQVARLSADQLDPARESLQIGAELVGSDSAAAAGEAVRLAIAAVQAAGATGLSIDFTLPDLVDTLATDALPLPADRIAAVRRELDMKDAGGLRDAGGDAYLPLLDATGPLDDALARLEALAGGRALGSRLDGLRAIAAQLPGDVRLTLDPSERHGFEYQSWLGFTVYAAGVRGALGRGGTYRIRGHAGEGEPATGFSLYPDALVTALPDARPRDLLYLPLGHDADAAARLRAIGWRTLAALADGEDAGALGATYRLAGADVVPLGR